MKSTKDKIIEVIVFSALIVGFVAYAIYNHDHTASKYVTVPNTPANENSANQDNCSGMSVYSNC